MQNTTDSDSAHTTRDATIEFYLKLQAVSPTTPASRYLNVTNAIIALNVAVFLVIGLLGGGWLTPSNDNMLVYARYGASNASATTNGEWWRLVTSMFMHYGIIHIAVNMWALYQVGAFFEKLQGRVIYALTYLAAGIASGFTSIIWNANHPVWSAGASGAIFGIYGAMLGYMLRNRGTLPAVIHGPIIKSTLVFAVYNIGFGAVVPGIDLSAHIGGFVCGAIYGLLLAQSLEPGVRARRKMPSVALAVALLAALVGVGITATPRYNYSAAELMEWNSVNQAFITKSQALHKTDPHRIGHFSYGNPQFLMNNATEATWMTSNLFPLYDDWLNAIQQMHFNPELLTAKWQALWVGMLQQRMANWHEMHNALVSGKSGDVYIQKDNDIMNNFSQQHSQIKPERLR